MADGAPGDCNMAWRHVELGNIFREARKLHCRATEFFLEMSQCRSATVPQSEARPFRARAYYERTHSNNALWSSNGEKKGLENNNTALGSRCCSSKSSESLVQQRSPSPARACVSTFATLRDMPRFLLSSGGSVHLILIGTLAHVAVRVCRALRRLCRIRLSHKGTRRAGCTTCRRHRRHRHNPSCRRSTSIGPAMSCLRSTPAAAPPASCHLE